MIAEELTSFYDDVGMRCERDAFDTLFDHAPDKLQVKHHHHYLQNPGKLQESLASTSAIGGLSIILDTSRW